MLKQIGGEHYGGNEFQHWDMVIECGTDYLAGVASKYLRRWRTKGGIQDVQKAIQYVDKLIEAGVEPTGSSVVADENIIRYVSMNELSTREAQASRLLFGWRTIDDLLEARAIMVEIIQAEVCSWPEMEPLMALIKPDGWQGYTFEGAKENRYWFRCIHCKLRFPVAIDSPPSLAHECDGSEPSLAYVRQ
jgi:hypothetical protein